MDFEGLLSRYKVPHTRSLVNNFKMACTYKEIQILYIKRRQSLLQFMTCYNTLIMTNIFSCLSTFSSYLICLLFLSHDDVVCLCLKDFQLDILFVAADHIKSSPHIRVFDFCFSSWKFFGILGLTFFVSLVNGFLLLINYSHITIASYWFSSWPCMHACMHIGNISWASNDLNITNPNSSELIFDLWDFCDVSSNLRDFCTVAKVRLIIWVNCTFHYLTGPPLPKTPYNLTTRCVLHRGSPPNGSVSHSWLFTFDCNPSSHLIVLALVLSYVLALKLRWSFVVVLSYRR